MCHTVTGNQVGCYQEQCVSGAVSIDIFTYHFICTALLVYVPLSPPRLRSSLHLTHEDADASIPCQRSKLKMPEPVLAVFLMPNPIHSLDIPYHFFSEYDECAC